MAAQCDTLSGYLQQSDQGSNSERSTDSPLPGSEEDLSGPHPLPDPEWTEERFRVDRKKLEIMLLGKNRELIELKVTYTTIYFVFITVLCPRITITWRTPHCFQTSTA